MTGFVVQSHICSLYEKKNIIWDDVSSCCVFSHFGSQKKDEANQDSSLTVMDRYNTFKQNKHTHTHTHTLIIYITQTHLNNKHNQMNIIYITFIKVTHLFHGKEGTG